MKTFGTIGMCFTLAACVAQPYRPAEIGLYEKNNRPMKYDVSLESIRYLPPSGIGPRSVSASGGVILLFTDIAIDFDTSIEDFSRTEIQRALSGFGISKGSVAAPCVLNADVLLLKQNEALPDETEIRYSIFKSGKQIHSVVMKTRIGSYLGGYEGPRQTTVQHFASGIHRNVYEFLRSPAAAEIMSTQCAGG